MRLSLLCAGAALATGLALSASSSVSSAPQARAMGQSHGHGFTIRLMPGVKQMISGCNYSVYAFLLLCHPRQPRTVHRNGSRQRLRTLQQRMDHQKQE